MLKHRLAKVIFSQVHNKREAEWRNREAKGRKDMTEEQLPEDTFPNSSLLGIKASWLVSHINECAKCRVLELERWHNNEEHYGSWRKSRFGFPAPIGRFTTASNSSSKASAGSCTHTAYMNSCRHTKIKKIKKNLRVQCERKVSIQTPTFHWNWESTPLNVLISSLKMDIISLNY